MSAVSEAAANTVLRIANLFEQNCALKHGLPKVGGPDRVRLESDTPTPVVTITKENEIPAAPAATESPSPGATVADAAKSSLLRRAVPWLLAAAGAGGAGFGVGAVLNQDAPPPVVVSQPAPTADGSLLQYLEDQGHHLPGGEAWPTK